MHPDVQQNHPGKCPQCGMKLVLKTELDSTSQHDKNLNKQNYAPLIIIIGLILLTSLASTYGSFSLHAVISHFMIGFFLVFSGFKILDLKGFAQGYSTYDLLAQKFYSYGYIYPFLELFFAFAMILNIFPRRILLLEVLIMGFSGISVAKKLAKHEKFQCACLGTFLKVPLTWVTLIEDFGMVFLAIVLFFTK